MHASKSPSFLQSVMAFGISVSSSFVRYSTTAAFWLARSYFKIAHLELMKAPFSLRSIFILSASAPASLLIVESNPPVILSYS